MAGASPRLLLLAAGLGARFGGDKQTAVVGPSGEFLLDYTVHDAAAAGIETVVVVVRPEQRESFHAARGARYAERLHVLYAEQRHDDLPAGTPPPAGRAKPWGTGHAVWAAREVLPGPFVVANADDFYGRGSITSAVRFLEETPAAGPGAIAQWAMVAYGLGDTLSPRGAVSRAVCEVGPDGLLRRIDEVTGISDLGGAIVAATEPGLGASQTQPMRRFHGREPVSMNLWALRPDILPALERGLAALLAAPTDDAELYLPAAVQAEIAAGRAAVRVLPARERWFGLTHREDAPRASERLRELVELGIYPTPLWGPGA